MISAPAPASVMIFSTPANPVRPFSTVSLQCHVELESGSELDVPMMVNIQWSTPSNRILINTTIISVSSNYTYSNEAQINSFERSYSGIYICMAVVTPASTFVNGSSGHASVRVTVGN